MIAVYLLAGAIVGALAFGISLVLGASMALAAAAYVVSGAAAVLALAALPLVARRGEPTEASVSAPEPRERHVLAVDDDPVVLDLITRALAGTARVTTAASVPEALALVAAPDIRFDGFLLDILLRETDGVSLCRHLRGDARYAAAPIAMLTRKSDLAHIERAFAAGADDYILKPVRRAALVDRISSIMRWAAPRAPQTAEELFAHPFDIGGKEGFLRFEAAQNFLNSAASPGRNDPLRPGRPVVAFRLRNARAVLEAAGPAGFEAAIRLAAEALARQVRRADAFLTYAGEGVFLCLLRTGRQLDPEAVAAMANRSLRVLQTRGPAAPGGALVLDPVPPEGAAARSAVDA